MSALTVKSLKEMIKDLPDGMLVFTNSADWEKDVSTNLDCEDIRPIYHHLAGDIQYPHYLKEVEINYCKSITQRTAVIEANNPKIDPDATLVKVLVLEQLAFC